MSMVGLLSKKELASHFLNHAKQRLCSLAPFSCGLGTCEKLMDQRQGGQGGFGFGGGFEDQAQVFLL